VIRLAHLPQKSAASAHRIAATGIPDGFSRKVMLPVIGRASWNRFMSSPPETVDPIGGTCASELRGIDMGGKGFSEAFD
jgi:hypothetical protein